VSSSRTDWWPPLEEGSQDEPSLWDEPEQTPAAPSRRSDGRARSRQRAAEAQERKAHRRRTALVILVVLAMLGGTAYILASMFGKDAPTQVAAVTDYPGPGRPSAQVVIESGDTGSDMARTLVDAGVVATAKAFTDAFAANPNASKIQPGTYNLLLEMKASAAVEALLDPKSRVSLKVTIPEGRTKAQIVQKISEVTGITTDDLNAALADPAAIGLPAEAGGNAEGWLFPSTYQVAPGATAAQVLSQMTALTVQKLQAKGVAQDQWQTVLIKASLIEREAGRDEDRAPMARVIENRLAQGWTLDIDATILYGLGNPGTSLTDAQLDDASNPYNTRVHAGLPPGPIASPGDKSIDAVLAPADGTWMYWCTVNPETKETVFSTTYTEHQAAVAQLNQWIADNAASTEPTP
jgi:UPF0755 protein